MTARRDTSFDRLDDGVYCAYNASRGRWIREARNFAGWGEGFTQSVSWFCLHAYHGGWWPGRWFWGYVLRLPMFGLREACRRYEESLAMPDGFWRVETGAG